MNDHLIDICIALRGQLPRSSDPALGCPSDETFASYVAALLPPNDRADFEGHALRCADCHELLFAVVNVAGVSSPVAVRAAALPTTRLVARLVDRGLQLVEQVQATLAGLVAPIPQPALGGLRRVQDPRTSELLRITGPGRGLDAIELQMQADGSLRLVVSGQPPADQRVGEILSLVLDQEGEAREQRPFDGRPVRFAPIGAGHWRVRLVGRMPGDSARELAQAELELQRS
jgi:hypothetical protein